MIQRLFPLIFIACLVLVGCGPAMPKAAAAPQISTNDAGYAVQSSVYPDLEWTLDTPPGEQYAYNNFNFILLAHIIEEVYGQTYGDYLDEVIFTPLKMNNTGYPDNASGMAKLYTDHDSTSGGQFGTPPIAEGAGYLYSSTEDLLLWNQALLTDQLMLKPELDRNLEAYFSNGDSAGLGHGTSWFMAGGGSGSPFATFVVQSPQDQLSVIVLINQGMIDLFNIWELIKVELF